MKFHLALISCLMHYDMAANFSHLYTSDLDCQVSVKWRHNIAMTTEEEPTKKTDPLGWLGGHTGKAQAYINHMLEVEIYNYFNSAATTDPGH